MKIDKQRWDVMNAILDELLELPESERLDKLRYYCKEDSTLFNDIAALLQECEADDSLLDQNALNLAHTLLEQLAPPSISAATHNALCDTRIGAYILKTEIGRGGMGVVYQAQRSQGDFVQTVAIKLLLNVSVSVSERFRREQQALAALNHPNITQLLDAGVTEQGLPYLIMEFIEGVPITDYCAAKNLTLLERLALLDQVAEALAFSHKNLIVHRDIKPSNILVTASGQVKLLDFSIAKLLDTQWALEETATHLHLLTPSYAAPEQVLNQPITVATDIYQLGLLYYRMLTGYSPLAADISSLHELVKIVCQGDVTRPSSVLSSSERLEETLPNTQELRKILAGDLDEIILKMLRKEPAARYASVEAFEADIYAYRHNLPVTAHKAAFNYQAAKYIKRNWRIIVLVGVATLSLGIYALSMKMQNTRVSTALAKAEVEQRRAEQVSQFLSQTFEAADPNQGGLKATTAADLLERARTKINNDLKDVPDIQAKLLNIFSKIYFRQQDYQKAEELLSNLLNNNTAAALMDMQLLAEVKLQLAKQKIGLGQYAEAEALLRQSLKIQKGKTPLEKTPIYGETLTFLGHDLYQMKRREEATTTINHAIEYLTALGDAGDRMRSYALNILATIQFLYGELDSAINNMRTAVALKQKTLGNLHTETSNTELGLARMLLDRDDLDEAQSLASAAYENIQKQLPPTHPYQAAALSTLAKIAQKQQQFGLAAELIKQAAPSQLDTQANTSQMYAGFFNIDILLDQGKQQDAKKIIELLQRKDLKQPNDISRLCSLSGRIYLMENNAYEARTQFEKALSILDPEQTETQFARRDKAAAFLALGQYSEAITLLDSIAANLSNRYKTNHSQMRITCAMLSQAYKEAAITISSEPLCSKVPALDATAYVPKYLVPWVRRS
jgi:serine/threonine-protein kinase